MLRTKSCTTSIAPYIASSRILLLKEATSRGVMAAAERWVSWTLHTHTVWHAETSLQTVDIWWKIQRRQGRAQSQTAQRVASHGQLWQKQQLIAVLCCAYGRWWKTGKDEWQVRSVWAAEGGLGCSAKTGWCWDRRWATCPSGLDRGLREVVICTFP